MKSIARQKIGEQNYESLNSKFPGIEGAFLLGFDPIAVMCEFTGKKIGYFRFSIKIFLIDSAYVEVRFDPYNKRIVVSTSGIKSNDFVFSEIKQKFNLSTTNNKAHAGYHGGYDFKYTQKNCKNVLNIIQIFISRVWISKK